jgi:hypothetical protein
MFSEERRRRLVAPLIKVRIAFRQGNSGNAAFDPAKMAAARELREAGTSG